METINGSKARLSVFFGYAVAIVYAPFAWGCVTHGTECVLLVLLALASCAGLGAIIFLRAGSGIPWKPCALLGVTVLLAWIAYGNPRYVLDEAAQAYTESKDVITFLPSTFVAEGTKSIALRVTALAITFPVFLWLVRDGRIRWKLFGLITLIAATISLIGIWKKASGTNSLLWLDKEYKSAWTFAVFRYHGHAAAFLNLCWPAALALCLRSGVSKKFVAWRPIWIASLVLILAGVAANSSKGGHFVLLIGLITAVILFRKPLLRQLTSQSRIVTIVGGGIALLLIAVALLPTLAHITDRWSKVAGETGAISGRLGAYKIAARMVPDAPWFGFGPGAFGQTFPNYAGNAVDHFWEHTHQDYLQTIVEWGFVGAAIWFVFFGGALVIGFRKIYPGGESDQEDESPALDLSTRAAFLALVMLVVHCSFDFPLQIVSLQFYAFLWLAILWHRKPSRQIPTASASPVSSFSDGIVE